MQAADSRDAEIAALRDQLVAELATRARLEEQFLKLRAEALELAVAYREEFEEQEAAVASGPDSDPTENLATELSGLHLADARPQDKGVKMPALEAAGFGEVEAQRIRDRVESIAMRQLYLSNTAVREGWNKSNRFKQAHRKIGLEFDQMREEYGEDRFDWILYATGRQNRIVVDSVLGESAAAQAGLESGDLILSYADTRVFNGSELRQGTLEGEAGELVLLEYERAGVRQRVYVPRGPVGVQLHNATLPPAS